MRINVSAVILLGLLAVPFPVMAHEGHAMSHGRAATLTGEVVDTGCYLGHAATGAKHAECAGKCITGGMPMGLLTRQGTLYLITMNHDNPDAYNKLKSMAGKTVTVTGTSMMRGGMKAIDVTSFKPMAS